MDVFRQLKSFYWSEKYFLFGSIFFLACATALGLVYPNVLRYLIDDVIANNRFSVVPKLALLVLGVIVVKAGLTFASGLLGGRLGNKVAFSMRNALYYRLQYLSFSYYDKAKTGDLMSRLTADLEAIRNFIGFGLAQFLNMFFMIIFGGLSMFVLNWQLSLLTFITMPILAMVALRFESKIHPAFRLMRQAMSHLTTAVQENIMGVRTVKSFARERHEVEKFSGRNEEYRDNQIDTASVWARYFPIMELLACLCIVILLGIGGTMVVNDSLTLGELVAFFSLIWFIVGPIFGVGFHINNYTQSKASGERILEILHHHIQVKDHEKSIELQDQEVLGHIKFDHVTFGYDENPPAVTDITVDAKPGSVIGFLGATGSGKTTIIQLLMRAYNVKEGAIYLDGRNLKDIKVNSLRKQIATVFQETFLFSSTIRNNIAYGERDISMDNIIKAAKLAQAHDFIMELPLGYDTIVGERGLGLSGGQKQRIAIARAFLRNPKILILDDATSAVDMETEHAIQAGFKELMKGRTTFIIAHRISSLRHADEIIVLENGHIVQRGTHQQLLEQPGNYLNTFNIQYADKPIIQNERLELAVDPALGLTEIQQTKEGGGSN